MNKPTKLYACTYQLTDGRTVTYSGKTEGQAYAKAASCHPGMMKSFVAIKKVEIK